jgi:phosphatidylinositol 4-kinase type 2
MDISNRAPSAVDPLTMERTGYDQLLSLERQQEEERSVLSLAEDEGRLRNGTAVSLVEREPGPQHEPGEDGMMDFPSFQNEPRPLLAPPTQAAKKRSGSILSAQAIHQRFDTWARDIRAHLNNLRSKGPIMDIFSYEIYYSVFKPPVYPPVQAFVVPQGGLLDTGPVTQSQFDGIVESVIDAITAGSIPKRIAAGSSGSYFVFNGQGKVWGVFKPKDEEPYGKLSPKWTKWLHRNLFPCFFGRSCLIPNNGYICEAAASVLDRLLQTFIVPYTDTVYLSSPAFYYAYFDRRRYEKSGRRLPGKVGSFQLFLHGYDQANVFLRKHPLPSRYPVKSGPIEEVDSDGQPVFRWTCEVLQQFREEVEKLVILDYIMRNTDRGLDNWMVKLEWKEIDPDPFADPDPTRAAGGRKFVPHLKVGAIDSGLAFPWKHPDEWRSYPFGWLFLPLSFIGQPFSKKARDHFLPILCSSKWWEESAIVLRQLFGRDTEFKERMWKRQLAVIKGQAFNVVEALKDRGQGPLELARRTRFMVWDDEMDIPVSLPTVTMTHAMDTPLMQPYRDEEEPTTTSTPPQDNVRVTMARPTSPSRQTLAVSLSPAPPKGRKRGGSLALEARFRELQGKKDGSRNIWHDLVNSDFGEPGDPNRSARSPGVSPSTRSPRTRSPRPEATTPMESPTTAATTPASEELGFSYAMGLHQASRKVVVERLQTVTSKPPVFTWW